jgi:hypothetical protein
MENSSSWGARVLPAPPSSSAAGYVMAVAEGAYGCDFLATWRGNSQTALAVSDTPVGPFRKLGVAVPPWSTNPALFIPPSGELVITTCGAGYPCAPVYKQIPVMIMMAANIDWIFFWCRAQSPRRFRTAHAKIRRAAPASGRRPATATTNRIVPMPPRIFTLPRPLASVPPAFPGWMWSTRH